MSRAQAMPLALDEAARRAFLSALGQREREVLRWHWPLWARPEQRAPAGDWRTWLVLAGRGFGKTRAGAEWVSEVARADSSARIALVSSSLAEARAVMVEGSSGLMAVGAPHRRPRFEPSLRRLSWAGGAQATLYSAADAESLRGGQHSHAWCDELGKWEQSGGRATQAYDNMLMGLRLGGAPRLMVTTTPRITPLVLRLLEGEARGDVVVSRGSTFANAANLPAAFISEMRRHFAGTTLGRQELYGEMLVEAEGALWTRALLDRCREEVPPPMRRVVVAVDPPASAAGDACGIVVAGIAEDGVARVMADASLAGARPERWARAVAEAAEAWGADRVVAEANQGGDMVESVLRAADSTLPVRLVRASRGKVARAEPVAALYEAGRVRHVGLFGALEDELCGLQPGGDYAGPGRSPDRADACVWALTELLLGRAHQPRIRCA